jgi:PKD repeat protein
MEADLSAINYSTYLGGNYEDRGYAIAVDNMSRAYVTGFTISENFPTKYPIQAARDGLVSEVFITELNETGTGLLFSSYLGGSYYDEGNAIAITSDGLNITLTGYTESFNFPIQNAYQPYLAGYPPVRNPDAFITKIMKIPPVANFTGTPDLGCSPLTVYFNDTSTNTPTSWFWEFGDGSNSTEQNPNHTYINNNVNVAKNFTVNLTACNIDGCGFISQVNFTRVCPQPFADFAANNTTGCLNWGNTTIQFNLTSDSGGVRKGPALKWNWSFGDGNYSLVNYSNVNVTHTYTTVGSFNVSLTYENTCCSNTTLKEGYIDIRTIPVADFNATPTSGLFPLDVSFFDNSTGRPSNWTWLFGANQGGSNEQNPEHTYLTKGHYTVRLQACNFCGCDWENRTAYIKVGDPNLSFAAGSTMVLPNGTIIVPTNDTTPLNLFLQETENGLSGYDLFVFFGDTEAGNITPPVKFPAWATNKSTGPLPAPNVTIKAVDMFDQVNPGATNVLLASLNLTGLEPMVMWFNVTPNELDDDFGNPISTNNMPANIKIVRLLPFPNKVNAPKDPFGNQMYWDVNGNGNIDFNDVTTYFQNMQWIRDNQYVPFFDYNGNGLVDFNDLILLFQQV